MKKKLSKIWIVLVGTAFLTACGSSPLLYCDNVPEGDGGLGRYYVCNDYNEKACVYRKAYFEISECGEGATCYNEIYDVYDRDGKLQQEASRDFILNIDDCLMTTEEYFNGKVQEVVDFK